MRRLAFVLSGFLYFFVSFEIGFGYSDYFYALVIADLFQKAIYSDSFEGRDYMLFCILFLTCMTLNVDLSEYRTYGLIKSKNLQNLLPLLELQAVLSVSLMRCCLEQKFCLLM